MQSPLFEAQLEPDPHLHKIVFVTGVIAMLCGTIIITQLSLHPVWRLAGGSIWILDCLCELRRFARGISWLRRISMDSSGGMRALDSAGKQVDLSLLSGSVVLPELAWLRVLDNENRKFTGLFARCRTNGQEWHRLQLLWRQSRKSFGHPAGP